MKYTRQLAQIKASQRAYEIRHHGRPTTVLTFEQWANRRFEFLEDKGTQIESGTINGEKAFRFTKPSGDTIVIKLTEIRADYERNYLRQGITA